METTGTPTPEELLDAGRRTIDRKALQKTIKDIFSYRNPLRQFMESYRFNVIRWSATNVRISGRTARTCRGFSVRISGRTARTCSPGGKGAS